MRNLKKMLSLVMALAMVASFMVVGASAADFTDAKDIENADAVNTLVALGIVKGRDTGAFDPTGIVTRAEMAKMICVAMSGGKDPNLTGTGMYPDTKGHWAAGYIDYCANLGIVAGNTDGKFYPDKTVTGTEAAKMILIAVGYNAVSEKFVNDANWDVNINVRATNKGLYDDVAVNPAQGLTRDDAAQMIFNGIKATMVKYTYGLSGSGGTLTGVAVAEDDGTKTILSQKFKTMDPAPEGVLSSFSYNASTKKYSYAVTGKGTFTTKSDFTALMGQKVSVIAKATDNVYGMFTVDSSVVATGYVGDIGDLSTSNKTIKIAGTAYDVDNVNIPVVYYKSGASVGTLTTVQAVAASATAPYSLKLIDNTGDGKADTMVIVPFTVAKVTYVGTDSITLDSGVGNLDKDDISAYEGIAKNDYVCYTNNSYVSAENKSTLEKAEVANGKVTGSKTGKWMVEGTWYTDKSGNVTNVNDSVDYIAFGGVIYYAKVTSGASGSKDLAMLLNAAVKADATGNTHQAQLLFADGTKKLVDTTADYYTATTLIGQVVTYSVNNDGEYTLTALHNTSNKAGYDSYAKTDAYKAGKVATYTLADDATVFVFISAKDATTSVVASGNSGKVYSGKEVKNSYAAAFTGHLTTADTSARAFDQALTGKTNGFTYTQVAGICVATGTTIDITSGNNYGYLTADAYKSTESGSNYLNFKLWTVDGELTAKWKTDTAYTTYTAGNLISFDKDGADTIKNVSAVIAMTPAAVTGYNGKNLQFMTSAGAGTPEKYDDDTVILYVNTSDKTGVKGGEIDFAAEPVSGNYIYNAAYPTASGTLLKLLVVDVNNKWTSSTNATATYKINDVIADANVSVDKVTKLVENSFTKATANVGETVTIPVTVTASANTTAPVVVTATITVAGGATITTSYTLATSSTTGTGINLTFTMPYGNVTNIVLSAALA
ncbi:MAG: S-layer homology domain-containing protein [Clostridia bacterium]|nr:S-layer homology domain-containing protein [Clostridia bacterium]